MKSLSMVDGKKLTDAEKRALIDKWWSSGGYKQMEINSVKVCTHAAMYGRQDALAHIVSYFYNLPLEKQFKLYTDGGIEHYLTRALAMEVKSSTSMFYNKYRKPLIRERELINSYGEVKYESSYELNDDDSLEGRIRCLRYFYDNELSMIDRWLVEQKVFSGKKVRDICQEFDIPEKDINRQWATLKNRLKRACKTY
jgi:hypothetical protein